MLIKTETQEKSKNIVQPYNKNYKNYFIINNNLKEEILIKTKDQLLNTINFNKYEAYMVINKSEELSKYIPPVKKINNYREIINFTKEYGRVILRPIEFSINTPIYFLEAIEDYIKVTGNKKQQPIKKILDCRSDLKELFQLQEVSLNDYFLQKGIRCVNTGELLDDIQVTMKKADAVNWKCSSLQFLISNNRILLNKILDSSEEKYLNILKKALPIGCKLELLLKQINKICQRSCHILDKGNPGFYEYKFEFTLDKEKKLWVTDMNILNSYKDFKQIDFITYSRKNTTILYEVPIINLK
ncbi:YheC/YheD family protein [Candidatus Clostridium stratigraminis]|uniref:YheC/YheD family protein n=1 Tax=Candidatus Clostridium stratigraminis TaxID=3381661 RepID=A0ABW8T303_9CLOT